MSLPRLTFASLLLLACLTTTAGMTQADSSAERVTVFAAASLKTAMDAIIPGFETATGHRVALVLAGSSILARQIQAGAPADVFISANAAWMDVLEDDGLIVPATRFDLAGNRLVLIAHGTAPPLDLGPGSALLARLGRGRLAVALTDAVPAGIYAKAALGALGLWDDIAPHLAETDNVRAALALVALDEAPMGIVYATDAAAEPRVSIVARFPAESHPAIVYPAALIDARAGAAPQAFIAWLKASETRAVLTALGFTEARGPGG